MSKRRPSYLGEHSSNLLAELGGSSTEIWLDAVLQSSFDGIFITDGDAKALMFNKSYESISGLMQEEILGKNMRELVAQKVISASGSLMALERREPITIEQVFKTGKHAIITSTPVFDQSEQIVMVVTNVRDITEIWELREQLVKSESLNRRYSSEMEVMRRHMIGNTGLIAVDETMLDIVRVLNRAAGMDVAILLQGEPGVGKTHLARYIYSRSDRREEKFFAVSCSSIPLAQMEVELFGCEEGVLPTQPQEQMGLLEAANHGTVLLSGVDELPMGAQTRLLDLLQAKAVMRVGATSPIHVDVRIIASTTQDLYELVEQKRFREDLYYRLNTLPIMIPPLRERRKDIPALVTSFAQGINKKYHLKKRFSQEAQLVMQSYDWPGNIRELYNMVERSIIMASKNLIGPQEVPLQSNAMVLMDTEDDFFEQVNLHKMVEQMELSYINRAYKRYGNVRDAAKSLGMDASTLVRKRRKYTDADT